MVLIPWTSFCRNFDRYSGNLVVRRLSFVEQFRVMVFTQLMRRESMRKIGITFGINANDSCAMGLRNTMLAGGTESRDWHIWKYVAAFLVKRARKRYNNTNLIGLGLKNTVCVLCASTNNRCLNPFDWTLFQTVKAAVKMHTSLDLRCATPTLIQISDGKIHKLNMLDFLPIGQETFIVMVRGYLTGKVVQQPEPSFPNATDPIKPTRL